MLHSAVIDADAPQATLYNTQKLPNVDSLKIEYAGQVFHVQRSQKAFYIGRGSDCDILVNDELTSRHHCKILFHHNNFFLLDHSKNGSFYQSRLMGIQFLKHGSVLISSDLSLKLGQNINHNENDIIKISLRY